MKRPASPAELRRSTRIKRMPPLGPTSLAIPSPPKDAPPPLPIITSTATNKTPSPNSSPNPTPSPTTPTPQTYYLAPTDKSDLYSYYRKEYVLSGTRPSLRQLNAWFAYTHGGRTLPAPVLRAVVVGGGGVAVKVGVNMEARIRDWALAHKEGAGRLPTENEVLLWMESIGAQSREDLDVGEVLQGMEREEGREGEDGGERWVLVDEGAAVPQGKRGVPLRRSTWGRRSVKERMAMEGPAARSKAWAGQAAVDRKEDWKKVAARWKKRPSDNAEGGTSILLRSGAKCQRYENRKADSDVESEDEGTTSLEEAPDSDGEEEEGDEEEVSDNGTSEDEAEDQSKAPPIPRSPSLGIATIEATAHDTEDRVLEAALHRESQAALLEITKIMTQSYQKITDSSPPPATAPLGAAEPSHSTLEKEKKKIVLPAVRNTRKTYGRKRSILPPSEPIPEVEENAADSSDVGMEDEKVSEGEQPASKGGNDLTQNSGDVNPVADDGSPAGAEIMEAAIPRVVEAGITGSTEVVEAMGPVLETGEKRMEDQIVQSGPSESSDVDMEEKDAPQTRRSRQEGHAGSAESIAALSQTETYPMSEEVIAVLSETNPVIQEEQTDTFNVDMEGENSSEGGQPANSCGNDLTELEVNPVADTGSLAGAEMMEAAVTAVVEAAIVESSEVAEAMASVLETGEKTCEDQITQSGPSESSDADREEDAPPTRLSKRKRARSEEITTALSETNTVIKEQQTETSAINMEDGVTPDHGSISDSHSNEQTQPKSNEHVVPAVPKMKGSRLKIVQNASDLPFLEEPGRAEVGASVVKKEETRGRRPLRIYARKRHSLMQKAVLHLRRVNRRANRQKKNSSVAGPTPAGRAAATPRKERKEQEEVSEAIVLAQVAGAGKKRGQGIEKQALANGDRTMEEAHVEAESSNEAITHVEEASVLLHSDTTGRLDGGEIHGTDMADAEGIEEGNISDDLTEAVSVVAFVNKCKEAARKYSKGLPQAGSTALNSPNQDDASPTTSDEWFVASRKNKYANKEVGLPREPGCNLKKRKKSESLSPEAKQNDRNDIQGEQSGTSAAGTDVEKTASGVKRLVGRPRKEQGKGVGPPRRSGRLEGQPAPTACLQETKRVKREKGTSVERDGSSEEPTGQEGDLRSPSAEETVRVREDMGDMFRTAEQSAVTSVSQERIPDPDPEITSKPAASPQRKSSPGTNLLPDYDDDNWGSESDGDSKTTVSERGSTATGKNTAAREGNGNMTSLDIAMTSTKDVAQTQSAGIVEKSLSEVHQVADAMDIDGDRDKFYQVERSSNCEMDEDRTQSEGGWSFNGSVALASQHEVSHGTLLASRIASVATLEDNSNEHHHPIPDASQWQERTLGIIVPGPHVQTEGATPSLLFSWSTPALHSTAPISESDHLQDCLRNNDMPLEKEQILSPVLLNTDLNSSKNEVDEMIIDRISEEVGVPPTPKAAERIKTYINAHVESSLKARVSPTIPTVDEGGTTRGTDEQEYVEKAKEGQRGNAITGEGDKKEGHVPVTRSKSSRLLMKSSDKGRTDMKNQRTKEPIHNNGHVKKNDLDFPRCYFYWNINLAAKKPNPLDSRAANNLMLKYLRVREQASHSPTSAGNYNVIQHKVNLMTALTMHIDFRDAPYPKILSSSAVASEVRRDQNLVPDVIATVGYRTADGRYANDTSNMGICIPLYGRATMIDGDTKLDALLAEWYSVAAGHAMVTNRALAKKAEELCEGRPLPSNWLTIWKRKHGVRAVAGPQGYQREDPIVIDDDE